MALPTKKARDFALCESRRIGVLTDDLDDLARRLRKIVPDQTKSYGIEASRDYDEVHDLVAESMPRVMWPPDRQLYSTSRNPRA